MKRVDAAEHVSAILRKELEVLCREKKADYKCIGMLCDICTRMGSYQIFVGEREGYYDPKEEETH